MFESTERSKGYRFSKLIILYAVYVYLHSICRLFDKDVQALLFERGTDGHETVQVWCARFGPDLSEALRPGRACGLQACGAARRTNRPGTGARAGGPHRCARGSP